LAHSVRSVNMHDKETVHIVTEMRHIMAYSYWIICDHKPFMSVQPFEISYYSTDPQILQLNIIYWI
jgi:hypothetical protein